MAGITTHVLDVRTGRPIGGMQVEANPHEEPSE
jgi:5-hydroxyisourate hydrolase-like protein (transthyretin family)